MADRILLQFDVSEISKAPLVARMRRSTPEFVVPEVRSDVLAIARRGWQDRAAAEYVGVMIVRRFHGLLVDLNAPMDLQEVALQMMVQEQQHADLCMAAARALGSDGEIGFEIGELQQARDDEALELQLMRMVRATYATGEVVAFALIRHALEALSPTPFREVLREIAADEVLHARIGLLLIDHLRRKPKNTWLHYPGDRWVEDCVRQSLRELRKRDVVEQDEAALFTDPEAAEQLDLLGIPPSLPFRQAYLRALRDDVPSGLANVGIEIGPSTSPGGRRSRR
jgi:hypothetical protein